MITILSRIVCYDIAELIYKFLLNDYFISKSYFLEMILENIIKKYKNNECFYNILSDLSTFNTIEKIMFKNYKYIIFNNYLNYDEITLKLIFDYINTIKKIKFVDISYRNNNTQLFINNHLNNIIRYQHPN
tara:strand:- start:451 stop:843 length:393 start_codon:yes stop_codon:yes gene_type:complete